METKHVKIEVADPTPLGLFGLAMVTLVASSVKLGFTSGVSLVIPWAMLLGGMAQMMAAVYDFKHKNLFGATAFSAYGLFWIAMSMAWMISAGVFGEKLAATTDTKQLGFAFFGYMVLTLILLVSTLKIHKAMSFLISLIVVLFLSLGLDAMGCGHIWHTIAAYTELAISISTFYILAAQYLNGFFGKMMLPLGKPFMK